MVHAAMCQARKLARQLAKAWTFCSMDGQQVLNENDCRCDAHNIYDLFRVQNFADHQRCGLSLFQC